MMQNPFEATLPRRMLFRAGCVTEAGGIAQHYGSRCLVFTGSRPERAEKLLEALKQSHITCEILAVTGEPTLDSVREDFEKAGTCSPGVVVAMGGGSVIDTAKAVAMLLTNGGEPLDYAEVIGHGRPVSRPSLPLIAIPTTAGTGTETTRNAVLRHPTHGLKVSIRSSTMLPEAVVLDPELTLGLPPSVTAATGMDALCQLVEAFVSRKANPWTDALCRAGIPRAAAALPRACEAPDDLDARGEMMLAANWSGIALASSGLGAAHGFAAVLGGRAGIGHGLLCATFLAPVCRANLAALEGEGNQEEALGRFRELASLLTGRARATSADGPEWLEAFTARLPLESLPPVDDIRVDEIVSDVLGSSSMKGNPTALTPGVLTEILQGTCRNSVTRPGRTG